jgi:hypothetical protein
VDQHVSSKNAGIYLFYAKRAEYIDKLIDQWLGYIRGSGMRKTGPPPLFCIGKQGKLRDDQHVSPDIQSRTIQLALFILEYP